VTRNGEGRYFIMPSNQKSLPTPLFASLVHLVSLVFLLSLAPARDRQLRTQNSKLRTQNNFPHLACLAIYLC
jgi:hypothetical protein